MIEDWTPHSKWHTRASGFSQEQEGKEKGRAGNKKVAGLLLVTPDARSGPTCLTRLGSQPKEINDDSKSIEAGWHARSQHGNF
jgi:hypothetical protein